MADDDLTFSWMKDDPSLYEADCGSKDDPIGSNRRINALKTFSWLPYWKRVWIFQEAALARNLLLTCGSRGMEGSKVQYLSNRLLRFEKLVQINNTPKPEFLAFSVWLVVTEHNPSTWVLFFNRAEEIRDLALRTQNRQETWQWSILTFGQSLCATDPRDHIYGLLGLAKLDVDLAYDQPVSVVYSDYVRRWLAFWRGKDKKITVLDELFFLAFSGDGMYTNKYQLPSWAPNYPALSITDSGPGPLQSGSACLSVFDSNVESSWVCGRELWVSGIRLDIVDGIAERTAENPLEMFWKNFNYSMKFGLRPTDRVSIL